MEAFMGMIMPVGFNYAPRGWAFCNGQTVPIQQNSAMFALQQHCDWHGLGDGDTQCLESATAHAPGHLRPRRAHGHNAFAGVHGHHGHQHDSRQWLFPQRIAEWPEQRVHLLTDRNGSCQPGRRQHRHWWHRRGDGGRQYRRPAVSRIWVSTTSFAWKASSHRATEIVGRSRASSAAVAACGVGSYAAVA